MKKRGIITGVAAIVALTAGIAVLTRYNPEGESVPSAPREQKTVLELAQADSITLISEDTELVFIRSGEDWTIDGVSEASKQKISSFVQNALSYKTEAFIDADNAEEYGLDAPDAVIEISSGGEEHIVKIGAKSAVADAYFASADGTAFVMASTQRDALLKDLEYYTSYGRIAINSDTITAFKIEHSDRTIEAYIRDITNFEGNVWQMRSPYDTLANDSFIDSDVLPGICALSLSLEGGELGDVRTVLTVTADKEYKFEIGRESGGYVTVRYEGKLYREPSQNLQFTDAETYTYMNKLVAYTHINDISSCTVEYDGAVHMIEVSGDDGSFRFKADGKKADADISRSAYMAVIGVTATGLYNNEKTGDTVLAVTYSFKDGSSSKVEYKLINEYTVAVKRDSDIIFVTGLADINSLKQKMDQYFNQE